MVLVLVAAGGTAAAIAYRLLRGWIRRGRVQYYLGSMLVAEVFLLVWLSLSVALTPPPPPGTPDVGAMLTDPLGLAFWLALGAFSGAVVAAVVRG